jgi:NAD-dependent deacetylase
VVWFGESLDREVISNVYAELERADVCLVIGTSALVQPAASFPMIVKERHGSIIEINIETTPLTSAADYHISGKSGVVLPELDRLLQTK